MSDHPIPALSPFPRLRRVFVILNPAAGRGLLQEVREALAKALAAARSESSDAEDEPVCTVHELTPDDALSELARTAAEQRGFDLVVAAGGDGTVSAVADGLVGTTTPLGILPLGTANVLARELGVPLVLDDACRLLFESDPRRATAVDAMRVNGRSYFTQLGVGVDALMIRDTPREAKRRFGRAAYLWTAFTGLLGFSPRSFTLECDGRSLRARATEVVAANCGVLGQPPFRWGPDIRPDDGRIDVCIARARSLWDYAVLAVYVVLGRHKRSPNVRYASVSRRLVIATRRPLPVQADGEIIGETPVVVEVVPQALRVLGRQEARLAADA